MSRLLIFDLDGVLVDVSDSYHETIIRTVQHFSGRRVTRDFIQQFKNRGGFNDDWALSTTVIHEFGFPTPYEEVVSYFQSLFLGENGDGRGEALILREKWMARDGLLERLQKDWRFAIFTGRTRREARLTIDRCAPHLLFEPIVGSTDVANLKPAPDGILKIRSAHPGIDAVYVGDNVDDARSARAAGIPFIGVAAAGNGRRNETIELLRQEGARAIISDINELEHVL
ncbi:MAG TPA: HAD family hydrolase [Bryobacterales bacterium]|jgi:HAD superfamily phosphatase|nr:HAD family hydrolase [Bryobacterales bacterium]